MGYPCINYGAGNTPVDNCADPNAICDPTINNSASCFSLCVCAPGFYNPSGCNSCGGMCLPGTYVWSLVLYSNGIANEIILSNFSFYHITANFHVILLFMKCFINRYVRQLLRQIYPTVLHGISQYACTR